jgi:branched-subunit amino acid transport protein
MTADWIAVILAAVGCYLLKLIGMAVPARWLDRPALRQVIDTAPVALLAALVVVQAFGSGAALVVDARAAGLAAGLVALLLRAPFIVVLLVAAGAAAAVHSLL